MIAHPQKPWQALEASLSSFYTHLDCTASYYIKDLKTGLIISQNEDLIFNSASMIKLAYLTEALFQVESGHHTLDETFILHKEDKVDGSGVLNRLHDHLSLTLLDLIHLMIEVSDNTATNMLFDILGKDSINNRLKSLGCKDTFVARKLMRLIPGLTNVTSARDLARLVEVLTTKNNLSPTALELAKETLLHQQYNDYLSAHWQLCATCGAVIGQKVICPLCQTSIKTTDPIPLPFYHKTGHINGLFHDGGLVEYKGESLIVVFMLANLKDHDTGMNYHHQMGELIINYLK